MTTLLICGSRAATPVMLEYARRCVERAYHQGWSLIVGDAIGIDAAVAQAAIDCFDLHPTPKDDPGNEHLWTLCSIFGLAEKPRHGILGTGIAYTQLKEFTRQINYTSGSSNRRYARMYEERVPVTTYRQRDEFMVLRADKVMGIWNGTSKGTLAVFEYAQSKGKEAWLKRP